METCEAALLPLPPFSGLSLTPYMTVGRVRRLCPPTVLADVPSFSGVFSRLKQSYAPRRHSHLSEELYLLREPPSYILKI